MKRLILFFLILTCNHIFSQGTAGEKAKYEQRYLIDMPTAGVLDKGLYSIATEMLPNGTLIAQIEAGIFENFNFGISYGGSNLIGSGNITWYPFPPGINAKFKMFEESAVMPAIAIGFDTQGKGEYYKNDKRYEYKAPGIFGAVSKNFQILGYLSLHGIINYSILEEQDGDNFVNFMVGAEKTLGNVFSILAEYNFAFNDNSGGKYGEGKGYLNMGIRWSISEGVTFGFDLRDLLGNRESNSNSADRGLMINFIHKI